MGRWVIFGEYFRWKGTIPSNPWWVERLEISLFCMVLRYWQTIIPFCHKTRICQTDGRTDRIVTAICCIALHAVKSHGKKSCSQTFRMHSWTDTQMDRQPTNIILQHFVLLKPSVIVWLHFECSAPYMPNLPFLISDIWALWRSGLSARVPKCQKLKMVG